MKIGKEDMKSFVKMKMLEQYHEQQAEKAKRRRQVGYKVFISYSSVDQELAIHIGNILEKNNVTYFLDSKDIGWGQNITEQVASGLKNCTHLIVIISPASLKSSWVAYEIGQAAALRKVILPYLIHPSLDVPTFIQQYHYKLKLKELEAYFKHSSISSEELKEVFDSLKTHLPSDVHWYLFCPEESNQKKIVWRSKTPQKVPWMSHDGFGRISIDKSSESPVIEVSYNRRDPEWHSDKCKISYERERETIELFIWTKNNELYEGSI
ncbi:MAG: hypothetical protein AUG51_16860 [Acidobacteria bacterium 13_1_20CM_3_53_8]|nr:MAG: hypothetical protein AUG51_16860 [Acidobacteria bacterium 13_1_20CM_3_53_8]